jgi:hypothetical protein
MLSAIGFHYQLLRFSYSRVILRTLAKERFVTFLVRHIKKKRGNLFTITTVFGNFPIFQADTQQYLTAKDPGSVLRQSV